MTDRIAEIRARIATATTECPGCGHAEVGPLSRPDVWCSSCTTRARPLLRNAVEDLEWLMNELAQAQAENARLRADVEHVDVNELADDLLSELKLELDFGDPKWIDDCDDPEKLRACLRRQQLAAAAERLTHESRAVVAELIVDPDHPTRSEIIVGTPTGDRAHERELAARLCRTMIALTMLSTYERNLVKGLHTLCDRVQREEIGALEAWSLVEAMTCGETEGGDGG